MNKAQETRKRNEQIRRERREREMAEHTAQLAALRQIRDDPNTTPEARLEAIKMLEDMKKRYVII